MEHSSFWKGTRLSNHVAAAREAHNRFSLPAGPRVEYLIVLIFGEPDRLFDLPCGPKPDCE
jgi:hypothetical protein